MVLDYYYSLDQQISLINNYTFPCSNSLAEFDTAGKIIFKLGILGKTPLIQYQRKDFSNSAIIISNVTLKYTPSVTHGNNKIFMLILGHSH